MDGKLSHLNMNHYTDLNAGIPIFKTKNNTGCNIYIRNKCPSHNEAPHYKCVLVWSHFIPQILNHLLHHASFVNSSQNCDKNIFGGVLLSDGAADYVIIRTLPDSIFNIRWNPNYHTRDLVEYTGIFYLKVT